MSKTGLVLEGGGMRGIYTAGVLDVFMEYGTVISEQYAVYSGKGFLKQISDQQTI